MEPVIFLTTLNTRSENGDRLLSATFEIRGVQLGGTIEMKLPPAQRSVDDAQAVKAFQRRAHEVLSSLAEQTKDWAAP